MANGPEKKFRIGYVSVTIWKNEGQERSFYSVELARTYKDGEELKNTGALNHADLPVAMLLLQRAERYIADQV